MSNYNNNYQQQQPQATPGMHVQNTKNAKNLPVGKSGREWSHGFCSCGGDLGTFCLSWFCPCIVYAQTKQRFDYLNSHGHPDPEHGGGCCSGTCMGHGCVTVFGFGWAMQCSTRSSIRARYNIEGGGCGDCCAALWCTPCELTQEHREIELEESTFRR